MVLRSSGDRLPTRWEKTVLKFLTRLRKRLTSTVEIDDKGTKVRFVAENLTDAYRPLSLWIKEPGTMAWIDRETKPGDCFLDIGANIGIYTLAAAHRVGAGGRVVAVEPHKVNSLTLLKNVAANNFEDRVDILPVGLSDTKGIVRFNYVSLASASTGSQLGHNRVDTSDETFTPVASELVPAMTVDGLIEDGSIPKPDLVKIDVDGLELPILKGMTGLLASPDGPRSLQIEINKGESSKIEAFMKTCGYVIDSRHYTMNGEKLAKQGLSNDEIAHNAIFRRAG